MKAYYTATLSSYKKTTSTIAKKEDGPIIEHNT